MGQISADNEEPPSRGGERRLITLLGIAQICSWGSLFYSFPLIAEAMRGDLGWSKPELYGAVSLGLAIAAFTAYPVGNAIDRGYGRQVMSLASVAAGIGLVAWSQTSNIVLFYVVVGILGGLQSATLYEPAFAVIARRFGPDGARRGITALTLWGGFASTVFIPLIEFLIGRLGWRDTLIVLGVINIVVCAVLYHIAIDPARDRAPLIRPRTTLPGQGAVRRAMAQPAFWALTVSFVAYTATFSALTFHFYPLLIERGLTAADAVAVLAVIGPAQVAGRILIWFFAGNAPVRAFGSAVVAVFPLTMLGLLFAPPSLVILGAIAALHGAANGMMTIVRGLAVPEMLSREAYGAINGVLSAPIHLVQAAVPLGAAWLWAASGGYGTVLAAMLVGAVILTISFWAAAALARARG